MNGYYTKNLYGTQEESAKGRLKIEVSNLYEFNDLLKQAEKEASQLNETLGRLRNFSLDIDFSIKDAISET